MDLVGWFEIPVADIERAAAFYGKMLEQELSIIDEETRRWVMLPETDNGVGGSLTQTEGFSPSNDGVLIYMSLGDDLDAVLKRVTEAGGSIVRPVEDMGENGKYAMFKDTEGNTLAVWASA